MMKIFTGVLLAIAMLPGISLAANIGDTMTTRTTTCSYGANFCTTTITDYTYTASGWVITSMRTLTTPYRSPQMQ